MKIEDDLRRAFRARADQVSTDDERAWDAFKNARQSGPKGRIVAGVVAFAVFIAAAVFAWQGFGHETTSATSAHSYTDPAGWSVDAPSALAVRSFDLPGDREGVSGVAVGNFSTDAEPTGSGLQPLRSFPPTGVLFMMWENIGFGPMFVNTADDATLPLSLADYHRIRPYVGGNEPTPLFGPIVAGGGSFVSVVWIGPQASEADRTAIEQTVASVMFPTLVPFSISPMSTAIVLDAASAYPVGSITAVTREMLQAANPSLGNLGSITDGGFYVVHGTDGYYAVSMEAQAPQTQDTCHVDANKTDISFSCANGAIWDRYVRAIKPPANDDQMHGYWLSVIPVTVSWDGHLLVDQGNGPQVALKAWGIPTGQ